MNKTEIYNEQIKPLVEQIEEICNNNIQFLNV